MRPVNWSLKTEKSQRGIFLSRKEPTEPQTDGYAGRGVEKTDLQADSAPNPGPTCDKQSLLASSLKRDVLSDARHMYLLYSLIFYSNYQRGYL